ncbi:MAG: hypothetical protein J6A99_04935 [Clostridia bacterium]|nr:hypothetical protein [Clostridia bacterium]
MKNREKTINLISLIIAIILSVMIIAVGICFVVSSVQIYKSSDSSPFTLIAIETHFRNIAVPCIILLVVLVISIIFNAIFPKNDKKLKVDTSAKTLYQLSSKFDIDNADKGIQNALKGISNVKIILNVVPIVIYVAMIVVTLVFACNRDNYTLDNMNGSVIDIVLIVLPCVIVGIAVYFVSSLLKSIFRKKEINLIKNAIKENKDLLLKEKKVIDEKNAIKSLILKVKNLWYTNENIALLVCRCCVLVVGVVFVVLGVLNGGMADVLGKAVRICTECIGLG